VEALCCVQNLLGAGPDPVIFSEVDPAYDPRGVDEKFGGTCDVATVFSGVSVNEVVSLDCCRIRVGEDREGESGLLDQIA
jgi:hypothetical protein